LFVTELPWGVHGKILEVDLSRGRVDEVPLGPDKVADYIGGRGLGARLLYDRLDPGCDALGPDNIIVIAAAPLIGTNAPTAGRGHMVFKSALSGGIGSSNCGGTWAPAFKATGVDALVIRGRAAAPVLIDIREDGTEILPAGHIWGKDVHQTTEALQGGVPGRRPRVLCMVRPGE
jgi:aldehyde:ferredoxin oxidoreductase